MVSRAMFGILILRYTAIEAKGAYDVNAEKPTMALDEVVQGGL